MGGAYWCISHDEVQRSRTDCDYDIAAISMQFLTTSLNRKLFLSRLPTHTISPYKQCKHHLIKVYYTRDLAFSREALDARLRASISCMTFVVRGLTHGIGPVCHCYITGTRSAL